MRFFGPLWEPVAIVALTAVASVIGGLALAHCDEIANPCAHRLTGQVHERGPHGEDALVTETWCAEYKPGRAPADGGAP